MGGTKKCSRGSSGGKDRERKKEKKKQMAGWGPSVDRSRDGRCATELPARSPFLSQQLVSLLAPSAWIRDPGWTDWPVGEDHSQKTLLISHRLPRPHSHTLSLFLSLLRADFSSKLCRGRAEDLENMSSWAQFQSKISTVLRKKRYLLLQNNAIKFLTSLKGYYTQKFTTFLYESERGQRILNCFVLLK